MAPLQTKSNNQSNNYGGEVAARRAVILASAYVVDRSTMLKGFHYSTTGADGIPSPPSSPPLAALTSANELALISKNRARKRDNEGVAKGRRGGAAHTIREECERLFCETMKTVFLGERDSVSIGSCDLGASARSPPEEGLDALSDSYGAQQICNISFWLELWDYAGGCSFRGFVAGTGDERCLFTFFDPSVITRDLKQALMAIIDLASGPLNCAQVVVCLARSVSADESKSLLKSLRWVGFDLITLDMWAKGPSELSDKWLFLGMEL